MKRMGHHLNLRVGYLCANSFELFVCLLAVIACLQFFLDPSTNRAVHELASPWDTVWNSLYGLGAVAVVVGLVRLSPRLEVVGLCLFTAAVLINLACALTVYGDHSWPVVPVYVGFAAASVVRAHFLFQAQHGG